jgi:hypothetical protein
MISKNKEAAPRQKTAYPTKPSLQTGRREADKAHAPHDNPHVMQVSAPWFSHKTEVAHSQNRIKHYYAANKR